MAGRIQRLLGRADSCRFGTLTLADDGKGLSERLDRLYAAFRELRKTPEWRRYVRGAVATAEVTLGKGRRHWHIHLHFIADGEFFPHALLKRAWHTVTGDSTIVDIRPCPSRKAAAEYIGAYIAKPLDVHSWTDEEVREYATAMHGRRLLSTSGTFHGRADDEDSEPDTAEPSSHLCTVAELTRHADAGHEHVRHAVEILSRLSPTLAGVLGRDATLPSTVNTPLLPWETLFAIHVCEEVHRCSPMAPDPVKLEELRRRAAGEPEPPPVLRWVQASYLDGTRWG